MPWSVEAASAAAPGNVAPEDLDLSHAALVAASTGHSSTGASTLLAMLSLKKCGGADESFGNSFCFDMKFPDWLITTSKEYAMG